MLSENIGERKEQRLAHHHQGRSKSILHAGAQEGIGPRVQEPVSAGTPRPVSGATSLRPAKWALGHLAAVGKGVLCLCSRLWGRETT